MQVIEGGGGESVAGAVMRRKKMIGSVQRKRMKSRGSRWQSVTGGIKKIKTNRTGEISINEEDDYIEIKLNFNK